MILHFIFRHELSIGCLMRVIPAEFLGRGTQYLPAFAGAYFIIPSRRFRLKERYDFQAPAPYVVWDAWRRAPTMGTAKKSMSIWRPIYDIDMRGLLASHLPMGKEK